MDATFHGGSNDPSAAMADFGGRSYRRFDLN
jgi:hypothetical protein